MATIALIGGTGSAALVPPQAHRPARPHTPFGPPSSGLVTWTEQGHQIIFLHRHGAPARIPPHEVNYRANIWAIRELGPDWVITLNTVGGIASGAEGEPHGEAHRWVFPPARRIGSTSRSESGNLTNPCAA